jgi:hypothetical protein
MGRLVEPRQFTMEPQHVSRSLSTSLIAALALGASVLAVEPASAMPVAGVAAMDAAAPATDGVEQVRLFRHRGYYRGFRPRGYGYRRGLPGHPIRRILRAL